MKSTKWTLLVALATLSAAFGWSLSRLWATWFGIELNISWLVPLTMILLALSMLAWTIMTRQRMKPEFRDRRLHPIVAARTAALALAGSRVGSIALGFYFGALVMNFRNRVSPPAADRVTICATTCIASAVVIIVSLWLERLCQIPQPPSSDGNH